MTQRTSRLVRVVSWNVAFRLRSARAKGQWLASLDPAPDLVLLQEVNPNSVEALRGAAGPDWCSL